MLVQNNAAIKMQKNIAVRNAKQNYIVKIKYFTDKVQKLEKISKGNWIDLRASEEVEMKQGEFRLIPLGIAVELPRGYEAHVVPRSSTFKNFGLIQVNHQGVIDGPDRETGRAATAEMTISGLSRCMRCATR